MSVVLYDREKVKSANLLFYYLVNPLRQSISSLISLTKFLLCYQPQNNNMVIRLVVFIFSNTVGTIFSISAA